MIKDIIIYRGVTLMAVKRRDHESEIRLTLVRAPGDPSQFSDQHQQTLKSVMDALKREGVQVNPYFDMQAAGGVSGGLSGLLGIVLPATMPVVGTIIGAWLTVRNGRKVRVKIGDVEVEAGTAEEVERLLEQALKIKERTETKPQP
jgi:hypothetical protein